MQFLKPQGLYFWFKANILTPKNPCPEWTRQAVFQKWLPETLRTHTAILYSFYNAHGKVTKTHRLGGILGSLVLTATLKKGAFLNSLNVRFNRDQRIAESFGILNLRSLKKVTKKQRWVYAMPLETFYVIVRPSLSS